MPRIPSERKGSMSVREINRSLQGYLDRREGVRFSPKIVYYRSCPGNEGIRVYAARTYRGMAQVQIYNSNPRSLFSTKWVGIDPCWTFYEV